MLADSNTGGLRGIARFEKRLEIDREPQQKIRKVA